MRVSDEMSTRKAIMSQLKAFNGEQSDKLKRKITVNKHFNL